MVFQFAGGRATLAPGGTSTIGMPRSRIVFVTEIGVLSKAEIDSIMPRGGPDRMTQYAAAQIQQQMPMRSTTVVAAMKPIPDGSSYGSAGTTGAPGRITLPL